ncbi:YDG domain-containing protein At5g47150-like [Rutidosis leptorrhynchoides]|uniref:YDG domain-containing protein At5g47150-like n=1 Tax=Rutidosis leptorrhynchoides TaxID=125765 RepID=UPI003A98DE6D
MVTPEQVIKRPLYNVNGCKVDDHKRPKALMSNSLGEKPKVTTNLLIAKKLSINSTDVDSNLDENNKVKRCEPRELGRKTYLDSRPASKVKFWDPRCSKDGNAQKWKMDNVANTSSNELAKREKIKIAMSLFNEVYDSRYQEKNRLKPNEDKIANWRFPQEVAKIVKQRLNWMDHEKVLGPVCGVQVGDKFRFRSQLQMVGLHCQLLCGIDYTNIQGKNLVISIVDSQRYSNESECGEKLIYCGHGGHGFLGCKKPQEDQKLERGNLALKHSMVEKKPVRVIRKVGKNQQVFVYDGLYIVNRCTQEKSEGKLVFKFKLNRLPGQPLSLPSVLC